jgi:hypothetical protein
MEILYIGVGILFKKFWLKMSGAVRQLKQLSIKEEIFPAMKN